MCGLCKLNAAALDTTVACGYNGIDQHNLGLLPPIAGIDSQPIRHQSQTRCYCPPSRGLIHYDFGLGAIRQLLPPIAGIDNHGLRLSQTPCGYCPPLRGLIACREWSTAQQRRPFHTPPSTLHTPSLRSPPHFPFRRGSFCDSKTITKNIFDLTVAPSRKNDIMCMNEKINAFCIRFGSERRKP